MKKGEWIVPNNKEVSQSWFELARIFAILTGLFFILATLQFNSYSNLKYNFSHTVYGCNFLVDYPELNEDNITLSQCVFLADIILSDLIEKKEKWTSLWVFLGFLTAFNSIVIWLIGKRKLHYKYFRSGKWIVFLFILNLFAILLFCFQVFDPFTRILDSKIMMDNRTFDLLEYYFK